MHLSKGCPKTEIDDKLVHPWNSQLLHRFLFVRSFLAQRKNVSCAWHQLFLVVVCRNNLELSTSQPFFVRCIGYIFCQGMWFT